MLLKVCFKMLQIEKCYKMQLTQYTYLLSRKKETLNTTLMTFRFPTKTTFSDILSNETVVHLQSKFSAHLGLRAFRPLDAGPG